MKIWAGDSVSGTNTDPSTTFAYLAITKGTPFEFGSIIHIDRGLGVGSYCHRHGGKEEYVSHTFVFSKFNLIKKSRPS